MQIFKKRTLIAFLFLGIGFLFLANGVHRGEHQTVEHKSNIICLECIGIG